MKLLVDHRRDLVADRTRIQSRLRWHLHELDPTLTVPNRGLRRFCVLDTPTEQLAGRDGTVAQLARARFDRCRDLIAEINGLER